MNESDLKIAREAENIEVTVRGRANFEYAVPLRELVKSQDNFASFRIDMAECVAMDSTFMGVLTMLALKSKKIQRQVDILNASPVLKKLLRDLGVAKLFAFSEGKLHLSGNNAVAADKSLLAAAETVSEAHKKLVEADESNADKFRAVIDFSDQDVERLKKDR